MAWDGTFAVRPDHALPPHLRAAGNTAQHWVAATARIRQELGFRESIDREVAIGRTVEWERQTPIERFNPHHFDYAAEDVALRA